MCKYSHQHINISDADALNCAMYGLGETCNNEHVGLCECCTRLLAIFDGPFASFLNDIVLNKLIDDQL